MADTIGLTLNGRSQEVAPAATIWQAARAVGLEVPTLCYDSRVAPAGNCRVCMVEVAGERVLAPACARQVQPGMVIETQSPKAVAARRMVVELYLADHPLGTCGVGKGCELEALARRLGLRGSRFPARSSAPKPDLSSPVIAVDLSKCILCRRCISACSDLQVNNVIGLDARGFSTTISFDTNLAMGRSTCVSCGECVSACPTEALVERLHQDVAFRPDARKTRTVCPYCGVGCNVELHVVDNRVVRVTGTRESAVNLGKLCVKGRFGYDFIQHPDRLTRALIRRPGVPREAADQGDPRDCFREASWDEALDLVAARLGGLKARYGPDALGVVSSAKCPNEENYLIQKFARVVLGTNNVDHCIRLCHASSVAALIYALGSGAMTNSSFEVYSSDVIIVMGSNTTENHPIISSHMRQAAKRGATLIVIDPRRIELVNHAHIWLRQRPGTDVALLNGLMHVILKEGLHDEAFIRGRTEGFEQLGPVIEAYPPERVEAITGVPAADLVRVARLYGRAKAAAIYWGMGMSQHTTGTDNCLSLINLGLLCGHVGREGTGLNPLRGQNNVQGAGDMGAIPDNYPGYQPVEDPGTREKFERAWGVPLNPRRGLTITEMMEAMRQGGLRGMYIVGENPLVSEANIAHARAALFRLEWIVAQDIFLNETARYADVVLPAACFAEKGGTYTNTDRRVQLARQAVEPPGEARADWEIICDVAVRMGYPMPYEDLAEVFAEAAAVTPIYAGLSYARLQGEGLQWPCADATSVGAPFLHKERFTRGLGRFVPCHQRPPRELPDDDFPFVLNTGRVLEHWHTGSMTRRSHGLDALYPELLVSIHPLDADELRVRSGDRVQVVSRRGRITARAEVTEQTPKGSIFIPFHFAEAAANLLTIDALDPVAKIPEYKFCAVRVERAA
ncbi:MAG: formate dehydrogenase subunit alpha [Deltaproteobacteria bacterium]|nr:formate dehydrogenase subunit alpha [Deltaproteobacteria bacterium]